MKSNIIFDNIFSVKKYSYATLNIGIWQSEKETILQYCNQNDPIIDIGCGAGRVAIALGELSFKNIWAIDHNEAMIKEAIKISPRKYNIQYRIEDVVNISGDIPIGYFKCAIFSHNGFTSIIGQEKRKKALDNILKLLQPNGIFIFTTLEIPTSKNSPFFEFWRKRSKIMSVTDDKFGDIIVMDDGYPILNHFTTFDEIYKLVYSDWFCIDSFIRDDTFHESMNCRLHTNNCRFFILQKRCD